MEQKNDISFGQKADYELLSGAAYLLQQINQANSYTYTLKKKKIHLFNE